MTDDDVIFEVEPENWRYVYVSGVPIGIGISFVSALLSGSIAFGLATALEKSEWRFEELAAFIFVCALVVAAFGGLFAFINCLVRKPTTIEVRKIVTASTWVLQAISAMAAGLAVGGRLIDEDVVPPIVNLDVQPFLTGLLYVLVLVLGWRQFHRILNHLIHQPAEMQRVIKYGVCCAASAAFGGFMVVMHQLLEDPIFGILSLAAVVATFIFFVLSIRFDSQTHLEMTVGSLIISGIRKWLGRNRRKLVISTTICFFIFATVAKLTIAPIWIRPQLKISRETTWFTSPVTDDGTVDYSLALHKQFSQDVTPDSNIAVTLYQIVGPDGRFSDSTIFRRLGIDPLPMHGDNFKTFQDLINEAADPNAQSEMRAAMDKFYDIDRPWSREQHPKIAQWLDRYESHLDRLCDRSSRLTKYYHPIVRAGQHKAALLDQRSGVLSTRHLIRTLQSRALLKLNEGKLESAWNDLFSTYRLARLLGQGAMLGDYLRSRVLESSAMYCQLHFLSHQQLTMGLLQRMRRQIAALPPIPAIVDRLNVAERIIALDFAHSVLRHDSDWRFNVEYTLSGPIEKGWLEPALWWHMRHVVNPNVVAQTINQSVDQTVANLQTVNRHDRFVAADAYDVQSAIENAEISEPLTQMRQYQLRGTTNLSEAVGRIFARRKLPNLRLLIEEDDVYTQERRNLEIAFALAAFRLDHAQYPERLTELVPDYAEAIPLDIFSGKAHIYTSFDIGYRLYSIGRNQEDGNGDFYSDDIVIEVGVPKTSQDVE